MSTILEQNQYGFDRNSRRTWQKRPLTGTQDLHHDYDALSQITGFARGSLNLNTTAISAIPAAEENWNYDPTGNWRGYQREVNGGGLLANQHRVHDRGNRMTQIENSDYPIILDRAGRIRQSAPDASGAWGGKLELEWDAWSRITGVTSNGMYLGAYAYDGLHRRMSRFVQATGVTWHSYYSDAWRPLEERKNSETTPNLSYLWGARHRDDLVRRDRAVGGTALNETRYVLMDYFNPSAITDEDGEVKERCGFSAFGVRSILAPDWSARTSSECAFEFAFQGQFLDAESGLSNYGYRYYSPYLGRWTCKDPLTEKGGTNLFALAGNNPVNHVDYLGLCSIEYECVDPFASKSPGGGLDCLYTCNPTGETTGGDCGEIPESEKKRPISQVFSTCEKNCESSKIWHKTVLPGNEDTWPSKHKSAQEQTKKNKSL